MSACLEPSIQAAYTSTIVWMLVLDAPASFVRSLNAS
jgi:hypothetical protein